MGQSTETGPQTPGETGLPAPPEAGIAEIPDAPRSPPVRAEPLLRVLERAFLYLDRGLARLLPEPLNPFMQTGAVAIVSLIIATASGVILLLWYEPSVHSAYESVEAMSAAPWTAGLMRSLHRYSSDACMFFVVVHALRVLIERRFTGPRWLPWMTGLVTLGILWFIGWTGYWLVWDARAQQVAVGTARMLDVVPIFADPMGRAFLTDAGVNSLLFFVVFFLHMLVPLAMAVLLWIHLIRISRPRFLTTGALSAWILASQLILSIVYPAENAAPARMAALSQSFSMDWWYLLPLVFTERLSGGALWALMLIGGAVAGGVPWWLGRGRRRPAHVKTHQCNGCMQCRDDCPYDAINLVPRTDDRTRYDLQAEVNVPRCVGCGICAGSCDTGAIELDWLTAQTQRRRLEGWLADARAAGEVPYVALVCTESAAGILDVDEATGRCAGLPGFRVLTLPCAAWTHMLTLERLLRRGAEGVVVAACGPGDCRSREGEEWLNQRLEGTRNPSLRADKVDRDRILVLTMNRTRGAAFIRQALAFREGETPVEMPVPGRALAGLAAILLVGIVGAAVGVVSDLGHATPSHSGSELIVSFKHPGLVSENCRDLTEEEKASRAAHMRQDRICDRGRAPVRLRVSVDGEPVLEGVYPASGIWSDGPSVAVEPIPVMEGEHHVDIAIGESNDPGEWTYRGEAMLVFDGEARRVVLFDRLSGFSWH